MDFDLENPLTTSEDFTVEALLANESDHMPSNSLHDDNDDDIRFSLRRQAFSLISQARYCYNVDPFVTYLAVNYLDRFIAKIKFPTQKRWIVEIIAISSLSMAAKMMNNDISAALSNLQRDEGFLFDYKSVHRMEALILSTLSWRMRSITPFPFLKIFISMFKFKDSSLAQALKLRASHIIFNSLHEMKLLEYKPSVIAASAFLCATRELIPAELSLFEAGFFSCEYVNKDEISKCLSLMQEMARIEDRWEMGSGTSTPNSVLDQHHSSSSSSGDSVKRRRLNNFAMVGPTSIHKFNSTEVLTQQIVEIRASPAQQKK